jgi:hypothetical protein
MPSGISSIGASVPSDYLSRIKGTVPVQQTQPASSVAPSTAPSAAPAASPGTGQVSLSNDVLSILQSVNPNSQSGRTLSNLYDSSGKVSQFQSGLYDSVLYNSSAASPIAQAIQATRAKNLNDRAANNSTVQKLVQSYNAIQNSQNAIIQKNVRDAVNAILGQQGITV